jgi:hypothetical protein
MFIKDVAFFESMIFYYVILDRNSFENVEILSKKAELCSKILILPLPK